MMREMKKIYQLILIGIISSFSLKSKAQSVAVGTAVLEDYYRRMQLLGKLDSSLSFSVRPLFNEALKKDNVFDPDSSLYEDQWLKSSGPLRFANGKGMFQVLPFSWQQQLNSHHPYGWNDGAMIPAKGYQTMLSAGFFAKIGPLSIQLKPEFVYAANVSFESYGDERSNAELSAYYGNYNFIDAPERFGNAPYQKLLWGQSSIRLTFGPASFGLSNENLWWGPGRRNSLIMGNTASGFEHLTLNTVRPIRTPIGSFETQVIGGRLEESGYGPLPVQEISDGINLWAVPRNDWRYLSGINLNYQPKWVPGLFLGFTRTFIAYHNDLNSLGDYIPFFTPFQKSKINGGAGGEETYARDQRTSLYARWLFPKAHAEVYFEYGINDNSYNFRDFIGAPDHSRAYLIGLSKMVAIKGRTDEFIQVNAELTQLSESIDGLLLRGASGFYYHGGVRQGYTNNGEVFGAGTGSGGNLQSFDLSWVKGLKKLGLAFERYEHNMDFYNASFRNSAGGSRRWVDFAIAAQGAWNYKNLLFNAKLQGIKSLNYQWRQKNYNPGAYYIPNNDVFNLHGELGVAFRF
jgi:hypothetical protein